MLLSHVLARHLQPVLVHTPCHLLSAHLLLAHCQVVVRYEQHLKLILKYICLISSITFFSPGFRHHAHLYLIVYQWLHEEDGLLGGAKGFLVVVLLQGEHTQIVEGDRTPKDLTVLSMKGRGGLRGGMGVVIGGKARQVREVCLLKSLI